jgi:hypothetical protein
MPSSPGPSAPHPSPPNRDALLDRLLATSEALRDAAGAFAANQASDLMARRQQLTASLQSALEGAPLTADQRRKLEQATAAGEQARQALLVKRETARSELKEGFASRSLNKSFKPYRPKRLGRLNIKL